MVTVDKELANEAVRGGRLCGFVPHRLEIKERPELNNFSFNILFMKWKVELGKTISGSALYKPDLATFKDKNGKQSMLYKNSYGGTGRVKIMYSNGKWSGDKFVNGKRVGSANGPEWHGFFIHLTMLGLSNGERCMFE